MARTAQATLILITVALALGACGRRGDLKTPGTEPAPAAEETTDDDARRELPHKP